MPVLRNVETMNYADIEKGLNALGEKVSSMFINCLARRKTIYQIIVLLLM